MANRATLRVSLNLCALVVGAAIVFAIGCGGKDELFCDVDTQCSAGYEFCDLQGVCCPGPACGHANTCVPEPCWDAGLADVDARVECTANTTTCEGDSLIVCGDDGLASEVKQCHLGCNDMEIRCNDLLPSNGLAQYLDSAANAPTLVLTDGASIDTDTRMIINGDASSVVVPTFNVDAPPNGVPIMVVQVASFEAADIVVTGSAALAIVSDGAIDLAGRIDVSGRAGIDGPGATVPAGPCAGGGGTQGPNYWGGGGGGGYGQLGGQGGSADLGAGLPGSAGTAEGTASIVPLRGGCRGGASTNNNRGGGGGGAIQLVSNTEVRLRAASFINAGGGGGFAEGDGAGSAGAILLEAPRVILEADAGLVANGGGGAGACGNSGQDGQESETAALGGVCAVGSGGNGGTGSIGAAAGVTNQTGGGGGGGGVGRIRVNTRTGLFDTQPAVTLSPQPDPGLVTVQ